MKSMIFVLTVLSVASAFTAEFPYDAGMTVRHETNTAEVSSWTPVEIPAVNGGMPGTDSVATLYAAVIAFCASDEENWAAGTNAVGDVQAALTMKLVDNVCMWMGYTDGEWVPFTGVTAEEGEWEVKVEIDYSPGAGHERIRYSVGKDAASMTSLSSGGETWVALGNSEEGVEKKVDKVLLYGSGETGVVEAESGCRKASGTIAVGKDFGQKYEDVTFDVTVADPWGVDAVVMELKDKDGHSLETQTNELVSGSSKFCFSGVTPCETYTYDLTLLGQRRGTDISQKDEAKEVLIGVQTDWFAFEDGAFVKASSGKMTVVDDALTAAAVSPRGLLLPASAAPERTKVVTVESTMTVGGAVQETSLQGLDAASAQGALTIVRFASDNARAWACRQADGTWTRLFGASALNGTYDVRMELDYRTNVVSYRVKLSGSDTWTLLADANEQTAFSLSPNAEVMTKASLLGASVSRLVAVCKSTPKIVRGMILYLR